LVTYIVYATLSREAHQTPAISDTADITEPESKALDRSTSVDGHITENQSTQIVTVNRASAAITETREQPDRHQQIYYHGNPETARRGAARRGAHAAQVAAHAARRRCGAAQVARRGGVARRD
jgi:hypothetical protein